MDLIDNLPDGFAVSPAHDPIGASVDNQHRRLDVLPDFAEVQRLQLLIKRRGTTLLAIRRVVPKRPLGMLRDYLAGSHPFHQVQIVKLGKDLDR